MIVTYITEAGGVGKTTLCFNLGWHLANEGKKVLVVDADPQNTNVTRMAGFTKEQKEDMAGLVDILNGDVNIKETVIKLSPRLSIIPANETTASVEEIDRVVLGKKMGPKALWDKLGEISEEYDYVFIDTSPAPSILHWLALVASDGAVLPVLPDAKSVDATRTILETCETVKQSQNQDLEVLAVVFNKFVKNSNLARVAKKEITEICRSKKIPVAQTEIRNNSAIGEVYISHEGITTYDPSSSGAKNIKALSQELFGV